MFNWKVLNKRETSFFILTDFLFHHFCSECNICKVGKSELMAMVSALIFGGQTNFSSDSTKHNINLYPPPSICHKKKTLRLKKQARWTTTYSLPDFQKITPFDGNVWNDVIKKAHLMIDGHRLELQLCILWSLPLSFLEIQSNENGIQIIDKAVRYH